MIGFPRHVGPRPPNIIARIWSAMLAAAPPRFWAQVGAGMALTLFAAGIVVALRFGPWTLAVERARIDALFWIAIGVLLLVALALAAITELRFGIRASKDGFKADVERDDDPPQPTTVAVSGDLTITPEKTP